MRKLVCIINILVCILVLSSCTINEKNDRNKVVINYGGSYSNALILIMKNQHIAEKYFVDKEIEYTNLAASTDIRDGIIANSITFGGISIPSYLIAQKNGIDLSLVCYAGDTPIKMYARKKDMIDYHKIGGNDRIALVGLNTILHISCLLDYSNSVGDISNIENSFAVMPHEDGLNAIVNNSDINEYITTFPTTIKADSIKEIECIKDYTDLVKDYKIGSVIVTSNRVATNNPEYITKFRLAMEDAMSFIKENPKKAAEIMSLDWEISSEDILTVLEQMPPNSDIDENYMKKLEEFMVKVGIFDE